jgi:hypothetical protein
VRATAPRGVRLVRVRPGISEPVPVRRAPAQITALLQGLRRHRGPHPDPGPGDLPLGRQPEREHGLLVILGVPVHLPAHFRHPQRDAVVLEQGRHRRVLVPVERPLVLADHDRVPAPVRIGELRDQNSSLRAPRPRQLAGLPHIEKLRRDHPGPGDQHHRLRELPRPRRHRTLPVLRRHTPVNREPQYPACTFIRTAAEFLRPRPQHIRARARSATGTVCRHHSGHLPLPTRLDHRPQLPHPPIAKHQHPAPRTPTPDPTGPPAEQAQPALNAADEHAQATVSEHGDRHSPRLAGA